MRVLNIFFPNSLWCVIPLPDKITPYLDYFQTVISSYVIPSDYVSFVYEWQSGHFSVKVKHASL